MFFVGQALKREADPQQKPARMGRCLRLGMVLLVGGHSCKKNAHLREEKKRRGVCVCVDAI